MATIPALLAETTAHSPSRNTATDPPPGQSYFPTEHPHGLHTGDTTPDASSALHTDADASTLAFTPGGSIDYNTTAATPDDVDIPGMLFAIPYPTPVNATSNKSRPTFLLYAPPRAAYRRPPPTPDGKKGKEKFVKRVERGWQEEVEQGKAIEKGQMPEAGAWKKTKGMFTRKASQAIQWLPDSNIEALSRVPPKDKMHQVLVFMPEDPTTHEIQSATGGRVGSRLDLEKQLQAARSKARKRSAISGVLLPITGVIDVLCPIPIFAFEIDAAYFTSQWQGLRKVNAMTSDVRLALEPSPHLSALSERLLEICHKLSPKHFPTSSALSSSKLHADAPPLPPRPSAPTDDKRAHSSETVDAPSITSAHAPPLPPRPTTATSEEPAKHPYEPVSEKDADPFASADDKSLNPFQTPDPSDGYSIVYTATLASSAPNTAPNTPATAAFAPSSLSLAPQPASAPHSAAATAPVTRVPSPAEGARRPVPRPPLATGARALAEAVVTQVRAAVPPPVAARHALDDLGALAADIERCLEKGAKEFVKTL